MAAPPTLNPPLAPLVSPPTTERHVGKMIFAELVTPDLAASEQFYSRLFGWTFVEGQRGDNAYAEASLNGQPVAALFQKRIASGDHRQPAWLGVFSVADTGAAQALAEQQGAKVLWPSHPLPDLGQEAVLADPAGAVFAILTSSSGDPPDYLVEPGDWIWSAVITGNPAADAAFYQKLFNYQVFDLPEDGGAPHLLLAGENYARASANPLPESRPDMRAHWTNFIRVDDADAAAAKVTALGGRILVQPRPDRHGGRIALVADPQGAPFGLLEWSETASREISK